MWSGICSEGYRAYHCTELTWVSHPPAVRVHLRWLWRVFETLITEIFLSPLVSPSSRGWSCLKNTSTLVLVQLVIVGDWIAEVGRFWRWYSILTSWTPSASVHPLLSCVGSPLRDKECNPCQRTHFLRSTLDTSLGGNQGIYYRDCNPCLFWCHSS